MSNPHKLGAITIALLLGSLLTACSPATAPIEPEVPNQALETESAEQPQSQDIEASEDSAEPQEATSLPAEQQEEPAEVVEGPTPEDEPAAGESPTLAASPEGIPFSEVEARSSRDNCWIVVLGNVYDFTLFVQQHPFGAQLTNAVCGKDATETFQENTDIKEVVTRLETVYLGPVVIG
jgi:cytochrome b involved in lipid metabolism